MRKKLVAILNVFMLVVFISYYGEIIAFSHTHFFPDRVITHSHPFLPGHSHTTVEFATITQLSSFLFTGIVPFILCCAWVIYRILYFEKEYILSCLNVGYCCLRAPPVSVKIIF